MNVLIKYRLSVNLNQRTRHASEKLSSTHTNTHKLTDCFTWAIELVGNNLTKKQRNFGYFEVQDGADGRVDDAELAVQLPVSECADIPRGVAFQTGRRRDLVRRDDAGRVGGA